VDLFVRRELPALRPVRLATAACDTHKQRQRARQQSDQIEYATATAGS
jgi:hypothetical protein